MMAMRFADLWRWDGRVERMQYALVGLIGFAIKHNLDRFVATGVFHRRWGIFNYWVPLGDAARFSKLSAGDQRFLGTMLLLALPFIWVGVSMTLRRLRDAGQPLWLVAMFFAPFVNLIFFLLLSVLPGTQESRASAGREEGALAVLVPQSGLGSALVAALATAIFGTAATWLGVRVFGAYGWSLFVALPFVMGYAAAWLHSYHQPRGRWACVAVAWLAVLVAGAAIVAVAIEGLFCLAMAAPIALLLATLGALVAYFVQSRRWSGPPAPAPAGPAIVLLCVPLLMGAEYASPQPEPEFEVRTAIEIAAPPEVIWQHLIAFPRIESPVGWPFRLGIAYPIEARLTGSGLTADRECRFSSGSFREPILVWDPAKHFRFTVSAEPLLMREWTPYAQIHVRHLEEHYFRAENADFVLTPLPDGRTRLTGTTTYRNRMWPGEYWRLWADTILHQIHLRVFRHIKQLAEQDSASRRREMVGAGHALAALDSERTRW